jgi:hypothetical protein
MSRTAFWIDGGGVGETGSGSAPPVGYGWYMALLGEFPVGVPNR